MSTRLFFLQNQFLRCMLVGLAFVLLHYSLLFAEDQKETVPAANTNNESIVSAPAASVSVCSNATTTLPETADFFFLRPYKPLYAIAAYDRTLGRDNQANQDWELQFQLSFKIPILTIPWTDGKLAFGYTQVSFWQAFNSNGSSPFRETSYAPELMASFSYNTSIFGLQKILTKYSIIHESNGRGGSDSRSWNRIYGEFILEWEHIVLTLKPWYRIPERSKSSPSDTRGDDNPDITKYMGYGELAIAYRATWAEVSLMLRNNLRARSNYGATQVNLVVPLKNDLKFFVQYFDGYGLSLIDYNRHSRRVGAGVLIEKLPKIW